MFPLMVWVFEERDFSVMLLEGVGGGMRFAMEMRNLRIVAMILRRM